MFGDDLPAKKKTAEFPRNFEGMSIEELETYINELKAEVEKASEEITRKKSSMDAAASIFKS